MSRFVAPCVLALAIAAACPGARAQSARSLEPLGSPPVPAENPLTEAKALLGKALFWEEQLSVTGTVACGTCHRPMWSGTDPRAALAPASSTNPGPNRRFGDADDVLGAAGVPLHDRDGNYLESGAFGFVAQVGGRKSPTVVNAAFAPSLFWDGRATGEFRDPATQRVLIARGGALESQALGPLVDTAEMGHVGNDIVFVGERIATAAPLALASDVPARLAAWIGGRDYPALFAEAFGTREITAARIAFAIASYERTLVANRTPLDAELAGTPSLTPLERRGLDVYRRSDCAECHGGADLSDHAFHYIGVRPADEDPGRFARTGDPRDLGAFRTPTLRDVAARPPYMHDGSLATLEAVVDFYDRGGDFNAEHRSRFIRPLGLGADDKAALLAFLRRPLTDARVAAEQAPFDRPTLFTESDRVPSAVATHVPGPRAARAGDAAASRSPAIVAVEPPLFGSTNFTIVLARAPGNARAVLVVTAGDDGPRPAREVARIELRTDGSGADDGDASVQLDLGAPQWRRQTLTARFLVEDARAPSRYVATESIRFCVFDAGPSTDAGVSP